MSTNCFAAAPSRNSSIIPSAGQVISSNNYNSDINLLYSYLQSGVDTYSALSITNAAISSTAAIVYSKLNLTGTIVNADISTSAAIAYSKLNLATSIVNADVSASAAIVGSKLDLTSPGAIGSTSANTGKFTTLEATSTLKLGTTNQGDILYDNGTSLVRLTPGTSGQFLKTQGAGANPTWATDTNTGNVIFNFAGLDGGSDSVTTPGNGAHGWYNGTATFQELSHICNTSNSANTMVVLFDSFRWVKIAGVNTLTVYVRAWQDNNNDSKIRLDVNGGALTSDKSLTGNNSFVSETAFTLDVSSLTNGTAYAVKIYGYSTAAAQRLIRVSNLTILGS